MAGNRPAATAACLAKQSVVAAAPSRLVRRGRAGRACGVPKLDQST